MDASTAEITPPELEGDPLSLSNLRLRDHVAYAVMLERRARAVERDALMAKLTQSTTDRDALIAQREKLQLQLGEIQSELALMRRSRAWRLAQMAGSIFRSVSVRAWLSRASQSVCKKPSETVMPESVDPGVAASNPNVEMSNGNIPLVGNASTCAPRPEFWRSLLSQDLSPPERPYRVAVGLDLARVVGAMQMRVLGAVRQTLIEAQEWHEGIILASIAEDHDAHDCLGLFSLSDVKAMHLPELTGGTATHNKLMRQAFDDGADVYVALDADVIITPGALTAMLKMLHACDGLALVEAARFPVEHPKAYDPDTFDTPWVSSECLAISRFVFEKLGGFDSGLALHLADIDLSWRAAANNVALKICPAALFLSPTSRHLWSEQQARLAQVSLARLAHKWRASVGDLVDTAESIDLDQLETLDQVPESWVRHADFRHGTHFAPVRW